MKLRLDPATMVVCKVSAEAEALSAWYDARPTVRRLWAIRDRHTLNVIVTLEPTMDNGDTSPAWYACGHGWQREIESLTGGPVSLEMLEEPPVDEFEVDIEGEIIAAIAWRDPTSFWKAD